MANNKIQNTLNKIANTSELIFGTSSSNSNSSTATSGKTQLEMYGREARNAHIKRNTWLKDTEYTKALVSSEYTVQTEFKVGND